MSNKAKPVAVPRRYENGWAVLIATGPTLTMDQITLAMEAQARGHVKLFGVNDAYRASERLNLDYLYACDPPWWKHHARHVSPLSCEKWTQCNESPVTHPELNLKYIPGVSASGLSTDPKRIHYGNNSGYQAMNVAYLMGLTKQILIGYTMRHGPDGKSHFFGDHPQILRRTSSYNQFAKAYASINVERLGMTVINCTPLSALECFDTMELKDALALAAADSSKV